MGVKVLLDPEEKEKHVRQLLALDGLDGVVEEKNTAYCPISLTSVPDGLKEVLKTRQVALRRVLEDVGITTYDPSSSVKYSPDLNRDATHVDVYFFDAARVASGEYFSGHLILPSSGQGVEGEIAKNLGKKSVLFIDENIRVSRMMPPRSIYLSYQRFEEMEDSFRGVFQMLQEYETGFGIQESGLPVLLGFPCAGGPPVDLEDAVYKEFPELQFHYNGKTPIAKLRCENPDVFYEMH